jgi:uncharacterized protein YrzB (UPF0473 family)
MSPEPEQQEAVITLEGDDGNSYSCQILDIFEFEEQEYALLLNLGESKSDEGDDEQGSIVIMRLTQKDEQSIFQTIESEEEFERVVAHVEDMVKQAEAEAEA